MAELCLSAMPILGGSRMDDEEERLGAEMATCIGQEDDPVARRTTAKTALVGGQGRLRRGSYLPIAKSQGTGGGPIRYRPRATQQQHGPVPYGEGVAYDAVGRGGR